MKEIPLLTALDVDARVQMVTSKGSALILLYKSARTDMRILDEVFGPMNWKRSHREIAGKMFCTISVWDEEKKEWVEKEDVGVPSNMEATKGEASDAFKRAGTNWGIGRELYDAPTIYIPLTQQEISERGGKKTTYARFRVSEIQYDRANHCFSHLTIMDERNRVRWKDGYSVNAGGGNNSNPPKRAKAPEVKKEPAWPKKVRDLANSLRETIEGSGVDPDKFVQFFNFPSWNSMKAADVEQLSNNFDSCWTDYWKAAESSGRSA